MAFARPVPPQMPKTMSKALFKHPLFWVRVAVKAAKNWLAHNAFQHAAALAFYTLFSMAPILIIAVAVTGFVYGEKAAQGEIVGQFGDIMGEESAGALETAIAQSSFDNTGYISTLMGIALLAIGATTVFGQLQQSLNQVWDVTVKPARSGIINLLKTRLLSLTVVLTIGFLLLVSLVLSTVISAVIRFADDRISIPPALLGGADLVISFLVISFLFGMIFKMLPDVKLRWSDVGRGAVTTAVLFIAGKFLISFYLSHTGTASTYGAAGSLVAVLLWVYYSSLILLYGAEFTRAYVELSGRKIEPKSIAARVQHRIIETS